MRQSVGMLTLDKDTVIRDITRMVLEAIQSSQDSDQLSTGRLQKELEQVEAKKKACWTPFSTKVFPRTTCS